MYETFDFFGLVSFVSFDIFVRHETQEDTRIKIKS